MERDFDQFFGCSKLSKRLAIQDNQVMSFNQVEEPPACQHQQTIASHPYLYLLIQNFSSSFLRSRELLACRRICDI